MENEIERPLPVATPTSAPFWEGLRARELRLQFCPDCERFVFYPRSHCPHCLRPDPEWRRVSGRGELHAFTIARSPTARFFTDDVPQRLAIVQLEEGVRLTSTLVDVDEDAIAVGMPLEPVFEETNGGEGVLLRFRPISKRATEAQPGDDDR